MSTMTTRRKVRGLATALAVAAFAALVTAPGALAASVSAVGGTITFTAGADETNQLVVTRDVNSVNIADTGGLAIGTGGGCSNPDGPATPNTVECGPYVAATAVTFVAALGNRGDTIDLSGLTNGVGDVSGGDDGDSLTGGPGADALKGEGGQDLLTGGSGADQLDGGANVISVPTPGSGVTPGAEGGDTVSYAERATSVTVTLDGVANEPDGDVLANVEHVTGSRGDDVLVGDAAQNNLYGDAGNDTLSGGGGDDSLYGDFGGEQGGNDVLNGEDGDDVVSGGVRADQLNGGGGDDTLVGEGYFGPGPDEFKRSGDDRYNGGAGIDRAVLFESYYEPAATSLTSVPVRVTLDDQANDGPEGDSDNVASDVEDVSTGSGNDTVTMNDAFNVVATEAGDDTIDPRGGSDVVTAGDRDDTITTRDGWPDDVDCGPGTDKLTADQLDRVRANCEQVDVQSVVPALEDRQPLAAFAAPASNARIDPAAGVPVLVDASDDRGVAEVRLLDDGQQVGSDTAAPYEFVYRPTGGDVGRNTLIAVAIDSGGQSGSDTRQVRVAKFKPLGTPTFLPTPKRDRRAPFTYRFAGKIALPPGVTRRQACRSGTMQAQTKSRAGTTFSSRRVKIRTNCSWGLTVTFKNRKRLGNGRLKARVRFSGNPVLASFATGYKAIRAG